MKNILVTGGKGYIGSKLVNTLKDRGHNVKVFDRPYDILNERQIKKESKGMDIVYHLAALAEIKYTDDHPDETFEVNILGTENVIKACLDNNVLLNFTSTCCIYGDPLEHPSVEDRLINPTDLYAMSKASGEYLVKMWGLKGLKYNILRFGTVYGQSTDPKMRADMCIQKFLDAAKDKKGIYITGDGTQNRNFIHIDDLVKGITLVTEKDIVGETINFAGKERISVNDLVKYALEFGVIDVATREPRKDDFHDQDVSNEKAKRLLGWEPQITFRDGITEMFTWLKQQS